MIKKPNIYGGGRNATLNGLHFEQKTSLDKALIECGYQLIDNYIYKNNHKIGCSMPKRMFYKRFLETYNVNYKEINSKQWLPDEAFINLETKTVYIIEKKFQKTSGSVDEKLPNCLFKKMEYEKLCNPIGYHVEYIYVLSDWFKQKQYQDTLEFILYSGCHYFYNAIPLECLGLEQKK